MFACEIVNGGGEGLECYIPGTYLPLYVVVLLIMLLVFCAVQCLPHILASGGHDTFSGGVCFSFIFLIVYPLSGSLF